LLQLEDHFAGRTPQRVPENDSREWQPLASPQEPQRPSPSDQTFLRAVSHSAPASRPTSQPLPGDVPQTTYPLMLPPVSDQQHLQHSVSAGTPQSAKDPLAAGASPEVASRVRSADTTLPPATAPKLPL